jgi:hypothetical protein
MDGTLTWIMKQQDKTSGAIDLMSVDQWCFLQQD